MSNPRVLATTDAADEPVPTDETAVQVKASTAKKAATPTRKPKDARAGNVLAALEPGGILSPLPDDHVKPAPVVLRYVGATSIHGHLLPPDGVPAKDLTQADIDALPSRDGINRMTIDDLLEYKNVYEHVNANHKKKRRSDKVPASLDAGSKKKRNSTGKREA